MPLLLASTSPIRRALLENAGLEIETQAPRVDEALIRASLAAEGATARDIADALADAKARKVSGRNPGALTLGADQTLEFGGATLSKCDDRARARDVLRQLRGQRHALHAAAVLCRDARPLWRHVGTVRLTMREFSDEYLEAYLDRNWPAVAGAVGAYHFEEEGIRLFSRVEGDYFNILGLPLLELLSHLALTGEIAG